MIADGTFVVKNSSVAASLQANATLTLAQQRAIFAEISTNWNAMTAGNLAQGNLCAGSAADKGNVFILAPNDNTARAIADAFAADPDVKKYVITGQDAEEASVQYIIDGKQSMTVFKDVRVLVQTAVNAAVALLKGQAPSATSTHF